jgi:2-polyprenyl-6-methoxyphenol hydroxylase-like FAD-dependent oxidoreductase
VQAVVLGGGMAGLLASRVLSQRCHRVTVVERDRLLGFGEDRPGVPQGRHAHAMLASGAEILEQLFPGLGPELARVGAHERRASARYFSGGGYLCRMRPNRPWIAVTRPLLEGHVRERVLALPNVNFLEGVAGRGLLSAGGDGRVAGVVLRPRDGGRERQLEADLVVDATGRGSRAPAWLEALGFARPEEEHVRVDLGYATRLYRRAPGDLGGDIAFIVSAHPPNRRMAAALAIEGDRWMVTLGGLLGEHPPTDDDGFLEFAAGLPCPDLHRMIGGLEPLGPAVRTRFPAHRRVRYERLHRLPERFVVMGDASGSFSPVYGQGMSVAAKEAALLARCLDRGLDGLPRRFYRAAAPVVAVPWWIGVCNDLRFPEVAGSRGTRVRLVNRCMQRVLRAARHDPAVARAFFAVAHLVSSPRTLLRPAVLTRVLWRRPALPALSRPASIRSG